MSYRPLPTPPAVTGTTSTRDLMDWRHRAECLDEDPELFFPIGNTGPAQLQIDDAKAVCARCEVQDTCLRSALETGQDFGVWGGMSEDERRAMKRRNARRNTKTAKGAA
jgi:WhiB family redox-sensing transcriptional regulator